MPYFRIFNGFYDLLSVFVIFLGLHRPVGESLLVVLFIGIVMDNLVGGPFGLYITIYAWILFGIRQVTGFLHIKNFFLLPAIVSSGVFIENVIFFLVAGAPELKADFLLESGRAAFAQVVWAACTGTFLLSFIKYCYQKLGEWQSDFFIKAKGNI